MVNSWYLDNETLTDRREPHKETPPRCITIEQLYKYAVRYWKITSEEYLANVVKEEGYRCHDEVTCDQEFVEENKTMMEKFYTEHLHTDSANRLITEGIGYFDIRSPETDEWIRIELKAGEMISIPAGIYHRFTPGVCDQLKAKRFFMDKPEWIAFNRSAGPHECNAEYLRSVSA